MGAVGVHADGTLVFFPWIHSNGPTKLGAWRLVPYVKNDTQLPDNVHRVLARYRNAVGTPVSRAMLLEIGGKISGHITERTLSRVFLLRSLMAFDGLARRELFGRGNYVNAHHFACIAVPNSDRQGVALHQRRRGAPGLIWHSEETYRVVCPPHVAAETSVDVDARKMRALLAASSRQPWLAESIELFNLANSDSPDIQPHTEVVLSVAALQRALGAESLSGGRDVAGLFVKALSVVPDARALKDCKRRFEPDPKYPARTLRELWFRDLYKLRSAYAHGETQLVRRLIWKAEEHLCLASYIFPRLVLVRLAALGIHKLTETEVDEIGAFDYLLCLRTFRQSARDCHGAAWPWGDCHFEAMRELGTNRVIAAILAKTENVEE